MDVHRILEMIGKDLYIFAVSTLQLFLNRCGLSVTRIGVGMHCVCPLNNSYPAVIHERTHDQIPELLI